MNFFKFFFFFKSPISSEMFCSFVKLMPLDVGLPTSYCNSIETVITDEFITSYFCHILTEQIAVS